MSYTNVFGGTTIYPSDVSYLALTLDADTPLEWPLENSGDLPPAARIIDVTATGAYSILLPDATQTGAGQTILFNNLNASSGPFTVKDYAGNTLATIAVGEQWQLYLAATTTAAGTWRVFRFGASTATVQPSALAGDGITVTENTLSQSTPVLTFSTSPRTALLTDRAQALVWIGTGTGTLNLPSAAVSTRLTQMFGRKWLTRKQNSVGVFTYYTVGTNYPAKDMPPTLKAALSKAQEVHRQKVATGTLHRKKVAEKKPKSSAPRKQTPHTNVTTSSKINVHQLPLGEARALYDELRKIFGA